jgi:hypothetical protein
VEPDTFAHNLLKSSLLDICVDFDKGIISAPNILGGAGKVK